MSKRIYAVDKSYLGPCGVKSVDLLTFSFNFEVMRLYVFSGSFLIVINVSVGANISASVGANCEFVAPGCKGRMEG
jgi:hypothetical protein